MPAFDDLMRQACTLAEAEQLEADCRHELELDEDANDPFLMLRHQQAQDLLRTARCRYESTLTDWQDGDAGEIL